MEAGQFIENHPADQTNELQALFPTKGDTA
jgi:hypothetical protein